MLGCGTDDGGLERRVERVADVELLHGVAEPVRHVERRGVVGQDHVDREFEAVVGAEHLLEVEHAVAVVVVGEPDGARARCVDERPTHPRLRHEPDHQRAAVRTEGLGLDRPARSCDVPDGDLVAETGRVDSRCALRRRAERRADRPIAVGRHGEVVHVGGTGVARIPFRPGTEVVDELARCGRRSRRCRRAGSDRWPPRSSAPGPCRASPSRRGERRTRCRSTRSSFTALERHRRAVAVDVEDVDPVGEQSRARSAVAGRRSSRSGGARRRRWACRRG